MLRDLLAASIFAATLWSIWQLGELRRSLSQVANSPLQRKMQTADRVVNYRFDGSSGPSFHLDGDETELRLITHLVLAPGHAYASDRTYDYGLRLRIEDPNRQTIWNRVVYTSTRQSKDEWLDGYWMRENAFGLEPGTEVTDDRVHLISLPRNIPYGSRISFTLEAPAASHGLLRAYERSHDTSLGLAMAYFGPAREDEERLVGRLTYLPWDVLTEEKKLERLRLRWNRLSAVGELGVDYEVDTIFYTGFRAPPAELPPPPPTTLVDDRATALTAWGPGLLTVSIHAECRERSEPGPREPGPTEPEDPLPAVDVVHIDAMGVVDADVVDPCEGEEFDVWLPAGPHTLHIRGHDLPPTTVEAWYDDFREEAQLLPGFELGRPFRPTVTRSPRVRLFPGGLHADYALVEPDDLESAMLQIRVQLPVPPRSTPDAQRPATVRFSFIDRHGRPIEDGEWVVEPDAHLEEYEWVVDAADADREYWVSPAKIARIIVPEGTHHLRIESDAEAIVSVHTYWSGMTEAPTPHPPYDEAMLVGTRWRRIPIDYLRWFRLQPHNTPDLQDQGQVVDLHGPIRLELLGEGDGDYWMRRRHDGSEDEDLAAGRASEPTSSPWVSIVPYTRHERRTVLERTEIDSPWARYARWRPGRATLALDDDWGATLVVLVDGDPAAALGRELELTLDGRPQRVPIVSTRSTSRLPAMGRGLHQLELGAVPDGVRVYIDRPTLRPDRGVAEVYRVITLYRLDRRLMGLWFEKSGNARDYVNALAYRCDRFDEGRLSVVLDEGVPLRRRAVPVDRVTAATRKRQLPAHGERAELVFFDRAQARCETLGRIPIPLGSDLSPGRHRIALRLDDGPAVWVRLFRRGTGAPEEARTMEWTERVLDLGPALDLTDEAGAP
ncbi:hypothetical protein [Paraliomyxa miuraensis]|uniref:hypothetical protein n=1 Tax=Paraliomyxa miuraensis TaxID=376150 RepID=UPI0022562A34|nr:hypothetical protein [Paraliomyxa miuraensis]MCX4245301.1 hypothetical protein [Paraliomyxa miuraensis]